MGVNLKHLGEGLRIFKHSLKRKRTGFRKYFGNANQICKQIVDSCWNGRFFQVSSGHFSQFYCRDFGWCAESLVKLGYGKEVEKSLDYALSIFRKNGKITTTITPNEKVVDVYSYSPDSLAFILRSLASLKSKALIKKYEDFLNFEVNKFSKIINSEGLVRKDKHFSSMKDYSKRKSSCYDNVMVAIVNNSLKKLKLENPLKNFNFKKIIQENFWTGEYFLDDLSGNDYITGDANTFPFWANIFDSKKMVRSAVSKIQEEKLDNPLPLKYTSSNVKTKMQFQEIFVKNYEQDTIWAHMGHLFIEVVAKVDKKKAKEYLMRYKKIIERYKNFLEAFDNNLMPYRTPFYLSDESMLWASNYLFLAKKQKI